MHCSSMVPPLKGGVTKKSRVTVKAVAAARSVVSLVDNVDTNALGVDESETTLSPVLTPQKTVKVVLSVICLVALTVKVAPRTWPTSMVVPVGAVTPPLHVMVTAVKGSVGGTGVGAGVEGAPVVGTGVGGTSNVGVTERVSGGGSV